MSIITEAMKKNYIAMVHEEMIRRGFAPKEIPQIIGKTGFMKALELYPEEQLHYDPYDAVNELLVIAARNNVQAMA